LLLRNSPLPNPAQASAFRRARKGEGIKLSVLKKRAEFLATAAHAKKWVTPSFIIQIAPAPTAPSPAIRYGLTASGKVGNAVVRNRCRRRLRAVVAEILPTHASSAFDYVLIARAATETNDYAAMKKDLLWALRRLGALRD
jgi:ribonuclease P protein component